MNKYLYLILLSALSFNTNGQCTYTTTSGTAGSPATWSGNNWTATGSGCSGSSKPSISSNTISSGDIIVIKHYLSTSSSDFQINNGTRVQIDNGGTLDLGPKQFSTSYGTPVLVINQGGTLLAGSISWANGNFSNSGTVTATKYTSAPTSTGNIDFTDGTIRLAANGYTTSYITATSVNTKNASTVVTIDGRLTLTGNLDVSQSSKLTINYMTKVSGSIYFAGGLNMKVSNNVYVEAQNVYVGNNSNLVVNGFLNSRNVMKVGLDPSGAQSGSSKISGNGTVGWGSAANSLWVDNNTNAIDCAAGTDLTNCNACAGTPNPFSLADCSSNILPVKFVSATGHASENVVIINWNTALQKNNQKFAVERLSQNGAEWINIGETPGETDSEIYNNYSFTDFTAPAGINYYRIRQIDSDGNSDLSEVFSVNVDGNSYKGIFPQPMKGDKLFVLYPEAVSWSISTISGNQLKAGNFEKNGSTSSIDFTNLYLNPDIYLLQIITNTEVFNQKLVIGE